jgi:predicted nucleotidyltransferase
MANGPSAPSGLDGLCAKLNRRWKALDRAREQTASLQKALTETLVRLVPDDTSFVTFGSIARQEYSLGSDVDWTLLVDGQVDPGHFTVAQAISKELQANKLQPPGPTATFGSVTFSHELVHNIGGQSDSNKNTTQRILLILESVALGRPEAYRRVVRAVLSRYLDNDISFLTQSRSGQQYKVPRFLLNDIVRYWRTMCVDYATKFRERQGAEWALRNAKLRMSRKLIFASGLMVCFSCFLQPPPPVAKLLFETPEGFAPLVTHLESFVGRPPTDIMADAFGHYPDDATAAKFFDAYAGFIEIISDGSKREHLQRLEAQHAKRDRLFDEVRSLAEEFQPALNTLFFESQEPKLSELTRKYGMF